MSYLARGNKALKVGRYEEAMDHYIRFISDDLDRARCLFGSTLTNVQIVQRRFHRSASSRLSKVGVVCFGERAGRRLSKMLDCYAVFSHPEVIGQEFESFTSRKLEVEGRRSFSEIALRFVVEHPYDQLHIFALDPRDVILGCMYKAVWGSKVIMDVSKVGVNFFAQKDSFDGFALDEKNWPVLKLRAMKHFDGVTFDENLQSPLDRARVIDFCDPEELKVWSGKLRRALALHPRLGHVFGSLEGNCSGVLSYLSKAQLFPVDPNALSADSWVRSSQELFKSDDFELARAHLEMAFKQSPNNKAAEREYANQYFYFAFSDWLMSVLEGRNNWYIFDGLNERPDWHKSTKLIEQSFRYVDGKLVSGNVKRYVQACLILAELYWDCDDQLPAIKAVRSALTFLRGRLPDAVIGTIESAISNARAGVDLDCEKATLESLIGGLGDTSLSVGEWLYLSDILMWNGFLTAGYFARKKAVFQALEEGRLDGADPGTQICAARAALDQGLLIEAEKYTQKLLDIDPNNCIYRELRACFELVRGDLAAFREEWPHRPSGRDTKYQKLIEGKRVAVVGPAPTGTLDGEEIDGHDIVVRFNYRGSSQLGDPKEFGRKTDVSLYNAHTIRLLDADSKLGITKGLSFTLIRRPRYDVSSLDWDSANVRQISENRNLFYKSSNSVPAVVFDLLLHGAKQVSVYKSDFYTGRNYHAEGYRQSADDKLDKGALKTLQPCLANHDLIAQINFVFSLPDFVAVYSYAYRSGELEYVRDVEAFAALRSNRKGCERIEKSDLECMKYQLKVGDIRSAEQYCLTLVKNKSVPENINDTRAVVKCLRASGHYELADQLLTKALIDYGESASLLVEKAELLMSRKMWLFASEEWMKINDRKLAKKSRLTDYQLSRAIRSLTLSERYSELHDLGEMYSIAESESPKVRLAFFSYLVYKFKILWFLDKQEGSADSYWSSCGTFSNHDFNYIKDYGRDLLIFLESEDGLTSSEVVDKLFELYMYRTDYYFGSGQFDIAVSHLREAFSIVFLSTLEKSNLIDMLVHLIVASQKGELIEGREVDQFKEGLMAFSSHELLKIELALIWSGLLSLSYEIRLLAADICIEEAVKEPFPKKELTRKARLASIEIGNRFYSGLFGSRLNVSGVSEREASALESYARLMDGDVAPLRTFFRKYANDNEREFFDYVNEKRIAVVAPAPSEHRDGSEIDDFDVVIRFGESEVHSEDVVHYGSKFNVASYNVEKVRRLKFYRSGDTQLPESVKYLLVKRPPIFSLKLFSGVKVVTRSVSDLARLSFSGQPNHVPLLLYYLLGCGASELKLFNVTFFAGENPYDKRYSNFTESKSTLSQIIAGDSLISGYDFVRKVWESNLIQADSDTSKVLKLGNFKYMEYMEACHLPPGRFC